MPTHDATDQSSPLAEVAEELAGIAESLGLSESAVHIRTNATRRMQEDTLRVAVLGEVNHGKSSLINALLGADGLPVSAVPTTHQIVRVRADETPGYYIVSPTARTKVNRAAFDMAVRDATPAEYGLEVHCSNEQLPTHIEIIDTPGLNDLEHFHEAVARQQLPSADVIVLVLDATQVLSRTERHSLDDALSALGGSRSGVVFELVINRIDLVAEHERPLIVEHVREQLQGLPFETLDPFLTDSRDGIRQPAGATFGTREVQRLRARLLALVQQRDELLPARAQAELWRQARLLASHAAIQTRATKLEPEVLDQEIEAIRHALQADSIDIDALRATIRERESEIAAASRTRVREHHRALEQGLGEEIRGADVRQLSEVLPGALRDAHLQFARSEADRVRDELEQLTRSVLHTHGEQARRRLHRATLRIGFSGPTIHIEPPSIAIEASTLLLGAVGTAVMYFGSVATGLIMAVASPLTHVLLRERTVRRARAHANETIPDALARTMSGLCATIENVIREHAKSLDQYICGADRALADQLVAVLSQARANPTDVNESDTKRPDDSDAATPSALERRITKICTRLVPTGAIDGGPATDATSVAFDA